MPSDPAAVFSNPPGCVLVTHEFAPFRGGVTTFVQEVAWAATRAGWPVEVWTVDYRRREMYEESRWTKADSRLPFPVVRFVSDGRLTPGGLLRLGWGVYRRRSGLRGRRVTLASVGAQMVFFLLGALGLVSAARVTCFFHGSEVLRFRRNVFWRWLARGFYARAEGFAVNSFHVEHLLRDSGLLPAGAKIHLARCALPAGFRRMAEDPDHGAEPGSGREEAGWRVLTVARLHPRKGQVEVARALALLPERLRARVVYQMVGTGEAAYRRQVENACREGRVRCEFLGVVADEALGAVYRQAAVYAQASLTLPNSVEGFGITFLEASFFGCPVAAYRSGGVDEAVRDGETGLLVAEGDRAGLAAAIGRLLDDPAQRERLGKTGRAFALGLHWDDAARVLCGRDAPDLP